MADDLTYPQQISIPYHYTAGPVERAFLRGLQGRRILASRWQGQVLAPARPFGPDGTRSGDLVAVGPEGTVEGWTTVTRPDGPVTYGLVLLDGATTTLLHRLDVAEDALEVGLRVRPRWAPDPATEITAIEAFEPAS